MVFTGIDIDSADKEISPTIIEQSATLQKDIALL